jgi:hypothetical protein
MLIMATVYLYSTYVMIRYSDKKNEFSIFQVLDALAANDTA